MVEAAQQDPVGDVRTAGVALPMPNVMRFRPTRGPVAIGMSTPSVTCGEGDALCGGEQSLVASEIEHSPARIESDPHRARVTNVALHGLDRHRDVDGFDTAVAAAGVEGALGREDSNRRRSPTHDS